MIKMTKFYDGKKTVEISMVDNNGTSFEADFFEIGGLPFDDEKGAYVVKDVDYLVDYAESYAAGENPDFDNFGADTPACDVIVREL